MTDYYEMPHARADECPHAGVGKACRPCRDRFEESAAPLNTAEARTRIRKERNQRDEARRMENFLRMEREAARRNLERAERAEAEVARLRTMVGDCHCDKNPETTNGPEEDCPQHGRPVAEVWDLLMGAAVERDQARAEVARLARPAPAWDEEAVVEAVARAVALAGDYDGCFERLDAWAAASDEARECGDVEEPLSTDPEDAEFWLSRARAAVAVVREHLLVKFDREVVERALHSASSDWDMTPLDRSRMVTAQTHAVLDLWPGRSAAEVKAEALREAADEWHAEHYGTRPAAYKFLWDRADRLTAEGGTDRG